MGDPQIYPPGSRWLRQPRFEGLERGQGRGWRSPPGSGRGVPRLPAPQGWPAPAATRLSDSSQPPSAPPTLVNPLGNYLS